MFKTIINRKLVTTINLSVFSYIGKKYLPRLFMLNESQQNSNNENNKCVICVNYKNNMYYEKINADILLKTMKV